MKFRLVENNEEFTITVYTYQSPDVLRQLKSGKTYIASYNKGLFSDYESDGVKNPYRELARVLGLKNCPIFCALDKKELRDMIFASSLETSNRTELLTLEVPASQVHETEYYTWTDYMYALEDTEGFEEQSGITIKELENQLKHPGETELCQVVIDRIKPEWLVSNGKQIKENKEEKPKWTPEDVEIYVMKKFKYRINDGDDDRAFILPNGDFLSTNRDAHIHIEWDIQNYLAKHFDIENFKHSLFLDHPVTDMCGWIRVNGINEDYVCLSSIKPTTEQYNALAKWLDYFIELEDYIKIVSYDGKEQQTYDFNEYTVDDVIKKIKRYYASGKLYESLEELSDEYDSEGNQLTKAQAEFFKNSKVRDSKGRLLVCYHGTDKEFDIFAKNKIKTGTFGNGFYFTTQKYSGDSYGKYNKKYYLNIKNCINIPIEYEDITEFVSDKFFNDRYNARMIDNQHATDILREKSFDGISVAMYNDWGEFEYYVVFEPNQIKSITNKTPTNSDNINEKLEPLDPEIEDTVDSDILVSQDPYDIKNFLIDSIAMKVLYLPKENWYVIIDPYQRTHFDIKPDLYQYKISMSEDPVSYRWYFVPTDELEKLEEDYLGEYTKEDFKHFITYVYKTGYMICLEKDDFNETSLHDAFGKPLQVGTLYDILYDGNIN